VAVASPPRPRSRTPRLLKPLKRKVQFWLLVGLVIFMIAMAILVSIGGGPGVCGAGAPPSDTAQATIPVALMPLYVSAEQHYGVPWSVLAAINSIETAFGTNMGPSSAGATGPMQFMPATWSHYGVDGNADGKKNIMDPEDAIPAAAKYLKASGAPENLQRAVFAYNHAGWYVTKVLTLARAFADQGNLAVAGSCGDAAIGNASPQAVFEAANALHAMRVPYNYGAGHMTPARPGPGSDGPFAGLDCSSSIAWVLQHAGINAPTLTSGAYMTWGDPGPGESVTLYTNPIHIIMSIKVGDQLRFFGTSGFGHPEQGTGPAWFTRPVSPGYLAGFVARHPPGL
jgi:cell wall-associated NlpC family hydrolase